MEKLIKEVEVKIKVADYNYILVELKKLGCVVNDPISQEDRIYLPNGIDFTEITTDTNVLRIRKENDKFLLTLKRNSQEALVKIEEETHIEDPIRMHEILTYMGYYKAADVKKQRIKCKYKDMEICLDEVEGLGKYIEVEEVTSGDPIKAQEEMLSFLRKIGVNVEEQVFFGYDILIYLKQHPDKAGFF